MLTLLIEKFSTSLNKTTQFPGLYSSLSSNDHYLGFPKKFKSLMITGENAANFLQGQLTCDIRELKPQEATLGAYCDYKGRVIANFWISLAPQGFLMLLPESMLQTVQEQLQKYALLSKASITVESDYYALLYCVNKNHENELQHLIDQHSMSYGKLNASNLSQHAVYWIIGNSENISLAVNKLSAKAVLIDDLSCELIQILSGFGFVYPTTSVVFTPQMLNLDKLGAVSFRKGCYVGQEIISRTQHLGKLKRHLHLGMIKNSFEIPLGAELHDGKGEVVGIIFSAVAIAVGSLILAVIQDQAVDQKIEYDQLPMEIIDIQN